MDGGVAPDNGDDRPASNRRAHDALAETSRALSLAFDLALPPVCPACREPIAAGGGLCARCWAKLSFIARPYCERLGTPFAHDPGPGILSARAIADPPAFGRARAAVRYDEIARVLVHGLKYGDRLELAPTLGRWMAEAGREVLAGADALVPVPLHWASPVGKALQSSGAAGQSHIRIERRPGDA
jgi:predicted amidophosphoribosyltransferase